MDNKENIPKFDECKRIDNKYKNINHMKFLYELYIENDYKIKVEKEKFDNCIEEYNQIYSESLNATDYLKYLVLNDYIRNKNDFDSKTIRLGLYSGKNDENLQEYIEGLNNDGVYFLNFYKNEVLNEAIKEVKKTKEEVLILKESLNDSTKDTISIMGLFSAIIAIIICNMSMLDNITIPKVVIVNASLILSITAIFFFIDLIINKKYKTNEKNTINPFLVVAIICIAIILISLIMSNNSLKVFYFKL